MTRRKFFRLFPALAAMPLAQWMPPEPRSADSPENLTWRITVLEFALAGQRAAMKEQGDLIARIMRQFNRTGQGWEEKPRGT